MDIKTNKDDFIRTMIEFEKKIEDSMMMPSEVDKYRENDKNYSKKMFKDLFDKKAAIHIFCKYILIRMAEDKGSINKKLNSQGIENWRRMSKNLKNEYIMLFQISCDDLKRERPYHDIFVDTVYDSLIPQIRNLVNPKEDGSDSGYIEKLKDYDFGTIDANTIMEIFGEIYSENDRKNLRDFFEPSPAIEQVLSMIGLK
jgi:hypothetical protein